ncbi:transposase, partial [Candidatus Poribacteria bacterium]
KELLGDKILVLDREFSYELMFAEIAETDMRYAIRLKTGNMPTILNEEGEKISLTVGIGKEVHYEGLYYKGKVKVNLAGKWEKGFKKPLWVIGSLKPSALLGAYGLREKIDESFRDMKNLLNLDKIMNKKQVNMEKMVALLALAYIIGFLIGEQIRDRAYGGSRKWEQLSGLFTLLKRKIRLARETLSQALEDAYMLFSKIILGNVRTHV